MNYKEKYEQSLERLKGLIEVTREDKCTIMEEDIIDIFPELKELEDERIKKELIFYLGDMPEDTELRNGITNRDVLAWLEKQNEQKSNPYSGVSFEYNGHIWGMCARDGGVEIGCDKQLIAYVNLPQEKDEFDNLSKVIDNKLTNCNTGDFIMSTAPNHGI